MSDVDIQGGGFDDLIGSQESAVPKGMGDAPRVSSTRIDSILRIPVVLQVVVGSATLPVSNLLKLGRGAVVPLDHRVGDPVDVVVNGRTIARGEVVVVEEDGARFGVSLTEICEPQSEQSR
jgi:flagellar motor switch protein FliN